MCNIIDINSYNKLQYRCNCGSLVFKFERTHNRLEIICIYCEVIQEIEDILNG
jgi:hypothetical protein